MGATDTDVVVVGAGPVGLMLAGELRLGGAEVIVLEARAAPTTESRASTLHSRTMELFDLRGLLHTLGTPPQEPMGHFGGIPLDLRLDGPHPGQWKVPQQRTEELLGARAAALGADVRRRHEVRAVTQCADHVEVTVEGPAGPVVLTARYAVGCDGEQSTVREAVGFDFPGTPASREMLRADVQGIDIPDRRFQRLEHGLAIAACRGGVTRVMVHRFGRPARERGAEPEFSEIAETWREVTGEDISAGTPLWVNSFGDAARQATRYRDRRVLLAGDAAHQQMPVGGQALNLGLQDAVNLGWKLAAELRGDAPDGLLDTYHDERHTVGRRVLSNIRAQAMLLLGGHEVEAARAVVAELTAYDDVRRHLAGMISGLDVRYGKVGSGLGHGPAIRFGRATVDADTGLRLPETAWTPDLLDSLRAGRGVLLVTAPDTAQRTALLRLAERWAPRVDSVIGDPCLLPDAGAAVVRPDGYLAWAGSATDTAAGEAALTRWFGVERPAGTSAAASALAPAAVPRQSAAADCPTRQRSAAISPQYPASRTTMDQRKRNAIMGELTGKTALVTGASRGMGRVTAERLAGEGALVAVHYAVRADAAQEVVTAIEGDGGRAFAVQAELGEPSAVHALFLDLERGLKERTGSTDLDILVNNAGVMGGVTAEDTTPELFDRIFAVNAKAPFFLIQRALANMSDGGRIINISSGLTRFANPDEIAYAMSKGAVEMLALHFAKLLAPRGITINSVAPGITRNSNPLFDVPEAVQAMAGLSAFNRVGEPDDVADVVAFLASERARWMTGSFVDATGGTLLG